MLSNFAFCGLVSHLKAAATNIASILMKEPQPLNVFTSLVLP